MKKAGILSAGVAMFAMMFGAGNVIFPLSLGREVGAGAVLFALTGFCLTAVVVPLLGIIAISLFHGNYKKFLGTMGSLPGAAITLMCMVLIGPFGCIPRCMAISHAAFSWYFPQVTLLMFSIVISILIFITTTSKQGVISVLGKFLGPIKFCLLLLIMVVGLVQAGSVPHGTVQSLHAFASGLSEGYGTMDLLAALFFTGLICASLRDEDEEKNSWPLVIRCVKAGIIGGLLLGTVYTGFCLIAAYNAHLLQGVEKAQLLSALAIVVLGSWGGMLASITVGLSCLTTAIALTTVFADYTSKQLSGRRIPYIIASAITVVISCMMTNLGFNGIMAVIKPVIAVCYPALIVLSIVNIAHKLVGFGQVKIPVFLTLLGFFCMQWW